MRFILAVAIVSAAAWPQGGTCEEPKTAPGWTKVDEGKSGSRGGAVLLAAPDLKRMFLVSPTENSATVAAFDLATQTWSQLWPEKGDSPQARKGTGYPLGAFFPQGGLHPYYQAAYDPGGQTIYCLNGGPVLYTFDVAKKAWKVYPPAAELEGLSWPTMACDTIGRRLVVVGADKKADNLGWCRTLFYDIAAGKWSRLEITDKKVLEEHRQWVAANEAMIDLVGRIRLAWYRDPKGAGSAAEVADLRKRCAALKELPQLDHFVAGLADVDHPLDGQQTLDALRAAQHMARQVRALAWDQSPVPCARRNSPLAFDAEHRVCLLFGGDHEDYLMNDTWVLDLAKDEWQRRHPDKAPSPRAGHALCWLPAIGRFALYGGYVQSSSADYGASPAAPLAPPQLWLCGIEEDPWGLAGSWPLPAADDRSTPAPLGFFDGYAGQWFCPPAMAADASGRIVLAAHACGAWPWRWKRPCETWMLTVDPTHLGAEGTKKLGSPVNQRLYRSGPFRAEFCETDEKPKDTGLDHLPANRWVRLPDPPRNPCQGCRQRDWGTTAWDSDRDQVLMWGGGHCVRSSSVVAHWSPASGRIVEGYDADEPYSHNGGGGFDSSLLNRPWVSVHNYHHYAYDPKCKLLVAGRGYLYDPSRMDWLRIEPLPLPFRFEWGSTYVASSPHGAVAWARKKQGEQAGLWLFTGAKPADWVGGMRDDKRTGHWIDLEPKGKLFVPYCDCHGMVYDSKRDRMLIGGVGGTYGKPSDGSLLAFDFQTRAIERIVPAGAELAKTQNAREMAYVEHADWVLIGELYPHLRGDERRKGQGYTRVYDCGKNKMFLLAAGDVPDGYSTGWMYDARRKLVYVFTYRGEAWAMAIDPAKARLQERP
ncbi:MAG: kelch repeat-containing protein [Thermoguttaceae bacterium]|jgi:hypothetical protein